MFTNRQLRERRKKVFEIISIVKLLTVFFSAIVILCSFPMGDSIGTELDVENINVTLISFLCIGVLLLCYEIWTRVTKEEIAYKKFSFKGFIEVSLFIALITFLVILSGAHSSNFKYLFLFAIVIFTVQFGIKTGLAVSIASSLLMFSIDLYFSPNRYSNQYFEADLVLAALFILSAFLLGRFVTIERDFSLTMGSYINIDTLTGCYNHRYFHEAIEKYIKGMGNEVNMLSVIILDINNFRSYNEKHGYTAGDLALEKIADIMKSLLRKGDIISRYAGEEFAVILPDTLEFEAILLGDKIRDTVNNTKFESADGDFINRLTVSIGVSSYPTSSKNKKMLINNIDESLYKAKYFNKQKIGLYTEIFKELRYELQKDSNQTIISIKTFISIINAKDGYTYGHTERVAFYCELFATKLGLSATDKKLLRYGAYLHDIGKMGIPKDILTKSEELTDDEWVIMKQHPKIGAEIIAPMDNFTNVLPLILYHHERYDGKGYPQQLKGENIPYLVKIVTLADSFDAMTSTRIYRHRRSFTDALEEIKRCTATQFDPELAPIFIEVAKDNVDTAERLRYVTPKDLAL